MLAAVVAALLAAPQPIVAGPGASLPGSTADAVAVGVPENDDASSGARVVAGASGPVTTSNGEAPEQPGGPAPVGTPGGPARGQLSPAPATGSGPIDAVGSSLGAVPGAQAAAGDSAPTQVAEPELEAGGPGAGGAAAPEPQAGGPAAGAAAAPAPEAQVAGEGPLETAGPAVSGASQSDSVATITVTSPNGGETGAPGGTLEVTWTYDRPVPTASAATGATPAAAPAPAGDDEFDTVAAAAEADGEVRVIVGLDVGFRPEGQLASPAAAAQRRGIGTARDRVLERLAGTRHGVARTFETVPSVVLELSPAAVERLRGAREVTSIVEDKLAAPTLAESVPLVEAPQAWDAGVDGTGQVVAVLDTGVDRSHPFLAGKVVEEACYSGNGNCPNGLTAQTGPGAGVPCTYAGGCNHGTHVAGIAAGTNSSFSGVGRGAALMAVQVFSRFDTEDVCGTGLTVCTLSYTSDQIAGLERVYQLRSTHSFAAVNMSLGADRFFSPCDTEPHKQAIDNLRSVGIATVVASGNQGYTDSISSPACISTAVSVGSTTKVDTVSSFSNSASFLSLLAPGSGITSSVPGGGYSTFSGTSMATPHVAGAWAVLKQHRPTAGVDTILAALQSTGVPVTDSASGIVKPRIRLQPALLALDPRVDIQLVESGSVVATIAENVPADAGSFTWVIPVGVDPGMDYRVRVVDADDPRASDASDDSFTIFSRFPLGPDTTR